MTYSITLSRPGSGGFTLLELVVVTGLLATLLGLGLGFLRRQDTTRSAGLAAVSGEIRRAAVTARSSGLPTEVLFDAGGATGPARVRSRILVPIGTWSFEPDAVYLMPDLRPELGGIPEPVGRFGVGRRATPDDEFPLLSLPAGGPRFLVPDGFALRLDLLVEERAPMTVLRIGNALSVELDSDLHLGVRMVQEESQGQSGAVATGASMRPVPFGRWFTLEVLHDGKHLSCRTDDREIVRVEAPYPLYQRDSDRLEVSPLNAPVRGIVDELTWLAYELGDPQELPVELELLSEVPIRFDRLGNPVGTAAFGWRFDDLIERFEVKYGGVVQ